MAALTCLSIFEAGAFASDPGRVLRPTIAEPFPMWVYLSPAGANLILSTFAPSLVFSLMATNVNLVLSTTAPVVIMSVNLMPAAANLVLSATAPAPSWTPDLLGSSVLKGWWDASNAGSITSSGGDVSQWDDLSGNANHVAQATGANQPDTGTQTINGLNVLVFDGVNDDLTKTTGVSLSSNDAVTVVCVRKHISGTSGGILMALRTGSALDVCKMGRDAGNTVAGGNGSINSAATQAAFADSDDTNPLLLTGTYAISGTNKREIFKNGTLQNSNATAAGAQAAADAIYIGRMFRADRAVNLYGNIHLGELCWVIGTGITNQQLLEGYMAWKWGLEGDLDAGHPYKSSPP